MSVKIFLDLEQTIIDNWQDGMLYKPNRVREWLNLMLGDGPRDISIFSFAIYNEADALLFERDMKHALELAFGIDIVEWLSVEEMAHLSQRYTGLKWCGGKDMSTLDLIDFIQIRGKVGAFEDMCMARDENDTVYILVDDIVPNKTVVDHKRNIRIEYVNVDELRVV